MIRSNSRIHEALDQGWLVIEPQPLPRRPEIGSRCPYRTSSVDLRLGNEVACFKDGLAVQIDLRRGTFADLFAPNSLRHTISDEQPFALHPNRFVLAKTLERIELPIREGAPCLAARVEGRSSYARCGILVHFTAPTIHAGFRGTVTLEIINLGRIPVLLAPGMPICQLILEQVDGLPFSNDSQFQDQRAAGGARV